MAFSLLAKGPFGEPLLYLVDISTKVVILSR